MKYPIKDFLNSLSIKIEPHNNLKCQNNHIYKVSKEVQNCQIILSHLMALHKELKKSVNSDRWSQAKWAKSYLDTNVIKSTINI